MDKKTKTTPEVVAVETPVDAVPAPEPVEETVTWENPRRSTVIFTFKQGTIRVTRSGDGVSILGSEPLDMAIGPDGTLTVSLKKEESK